MKLNNLFANAASKALALAAAVMMMGMTFTACSSDNDDTPKFTNTVTLDGEVIKIEKLEMNKIGEVYWLSIKLEKEKKATDILIALNHSTLNNKLIDLTQQTGSAVSTWSISVLKGINWLFCGYGVKHEKFKFSGGTMKININPTTKEVEVTVTGGKINTPTDTNQGDGQDHTISISYKGKAK
ncbi:hypothetical protein [Prevotella koreensis]|uniref:Lipocalin-like domain-containing protein n=1 Tax=Prevotella koreensis TaxID=2490854 RepID=A0A3S0WL47_9BACT|nr:hypothetical protein [Prevotella koreensis]RUL59963.1 hypothetical protein EHV08_09540 [Prevotella koreensis]RUL59964.1 hypothetical protein EHV08_09545 [Prevotella koreensis]